MTTASATTSPSFAAPSNRDAAMPAATVSTCSYGASPSPRAIRHLRDRQRMVADQFNLAVGGLHRSALALLAARAACTLVPFRAAGNPAAHGRGPADALVRLRHLPFDVFRCGDCGGRHVTGVVQRGRRRNYGNRVLRELVPVQSPVAARGCDWLVDCHAPALWPAPPHRGAAALGHAHATPA